MDVMAVSNGVRRDLPIRTSEKLSVIARSIKPQVVGRVQQPGDAQVMSMISLFIPVSALLGTY